MKDNRVFVDTDIFVCASLDAKRPEGKRYKVVELLQEVKNGKTLPGSEAAIRVFLLGLSFTGIGA